MHWVDRGPEPAGLSEIRSRYTPGWVQHYRNGIGDRPPKDGRWRDFHEVLAQRFSRLCAYCEEVCKGEVDHFRPKSRFPDLVYEWTNWLLACTPCNRAKGDKWPSAGYVNPCADSPPSRPERYFTYDTVTGEIIPRANLSSPMRERAIGMIEGLKLNDHHHLKSRLERILLVHYYTDVPSSEVADMINWLTSRETEHSSIARALLTELGYAVGY